MGAILSQSDIIKVPIDIKPVLVQVWFGITHAVSMRVPTVTSYCKNVLINEDNCRHTHANSNRRNTTQQAYKKMKTFCKILGIEICSNVICF